MQQIDTDAAAPLYTERRRLAGPRPNTDRPLEGPIGSPTEHEKTETIEIARRWPE